MFTAYISIDVEALPGRAERAPVDTLIWGKVDGGEFGIRRMAQIFSQYNFVANFMVDVSIAEMYGEQVLRHIIKTILNLGHEVHMHQHIENSLRHWGIHPDRSAIGHDEIGPDDSIRMLQHGALLFHMCRGQKPTVFRAGGLRFSRHTIEALPAAGIWCASNARGVSWGGNTWRWPNGVGELPLDLNADPLPKALTLLPKTLSEVQEKPRSTFNMLLHSWSLLRRAPDGMHRHYDPEYESALHDICRQLQGKATVAGYSTLTPHAWPQRSDWSALPPQRPFAPLLAHELVCSLCGAMLSRNVMTSDRCVSCGSRVRHRHLLHAFAQVGNPFAGRSVLACHANPLEKTVFLSCARHVTNFDVRPISYCDMQMDIQHMDGVANHSYECFFAAHVLNHVKDDMSALREIHRVLVPGGLVVFTVPYRDHEATVELDDPARDYGKDNLERYGVGSFRRYGRDDFLARLQKHFEPFTVSAFDPITGETAEVFFARKSQNAS
ncbi:MAG: methyltransferase domain-containing protein [Planctomycetota bacterium]|nr:methyltransferase domain-containing protein [Planctomycetota bacterium]